jgi:hypothetical protein
MRILPARMISGRVIVSQWHGFPKSQEVVVVIEMMGLLMQEVHVVRPLYIIQGTPQWLFPSPEVPVLR